MNHEMNSTEQRLSFWQRVLPHPLLTLVLVLLWLALVNEYSHGSLVLAILLGVAIPIYTSNFWPDRPIIRSPFRALCSSQSSVGTS